MGVGLAILYLVIYGEGFVDAIPLAILLMSCLGIRLDLTVPLRYHRFKTADTEGSHMNLTNSLKTLFKETAQSLKGHLAAALWLKQ